MTTPRKVFAGNTVDATPPIPFEIVLTNGKGETKTMEFEAFGDAPADALLAMGKMGRVTKSGEEAVDVSGLGDWFESVLVTESAPRWRAMIEDRVWMVKGEMLGEVFQWLQEQWTDRPTVPSPI